MYQQQQRQRMIYNPQQQTTVEEEIVVKKEKEVGAIKECEVFNEYLTKVWNLATSSKAKHWTTTGPNFLSIHPFYDEIWEWARDSIDNVAESLTGNGIKFTMITGSIASVDNCDDGASWREMFKEECDDLICVKEALYAAIEKADDYCLEGLCNILQGQAESLEVFIYKTKQTLA